MSTNSKAMKTDKKPLYNSKPKHYAIKRTPIESKPMGKKPTLIRSDKSATKEKAKPISYINSHRLSASQKTMSKIEIEAKEKKKEDEDFSLFDQKEDNNYLAEKKSELEIELKKLNDKSIKIKTTIALNEKKNINVLRDIENRDNYISMKNHKLSKLKKDNVELKAKLEELNSDRKAGLESSIQNENDSNPIDELFFRLIASCQYARDEEEEEKPLSTDILIQIPVLAYNSYVHSDTRKCLLCNFELCNNDLIMQIPSCLHLFHNACLVNYFHRANTCPSCSEEVKYI